MNHVLIEDHKAQNTPAGTITAGVWVTRDLNTVIENDGNIAALFANQITLPAGTYRCRARCPAYAVNRHQARIQNVTDGVTLLTGSSEYAWEQGVENESIISGTFTLSALKAIELQHQCAQTKSGNGLGVEANIGTEVYASLELVQISQSAPAASQPTILFMGDSVTLGVRTGVDESQTFRALTCAALNLAGINAGVPGDNSADMLSRLPVALTAKPAIVTLMSGINDALGGTNKAPLTLDQFIANMQQMIDMCAPARTVLLASNAMAQLNSQLKPFILATRTIAERNKTLAFVDAYQLFAEYSVENPPLVNLLVSGTDWQHPGPAGHQLITQGLIAALMR